MNILYISGTPSDGVDELWRTGAIRNAAMKASNYMAKHAGTLKVDKTEILDMDLSNQANPDDLPKICYYYQLHVITSYSIHYTKLYDNVSTAYKSEVRQVTRAVPCKMSRRARPHR